MFLETLLIVAVGALQLNLIINMKVFDGFILSLKILSLCTFTSIFLYWSITAIIKFKSGPTTSTVSDKFGDDGHGSYVFPAITICLDTFNQFALYPNGMKKNCHSNGFFGKFITDFYQALKYCTYYKNGNKPSLRNTTKTNAGLIGTLFGTKKVEEVYPFKKIEDFLNVSKLLEITDILGSFRFGKQLDTTVSYFKISNSDEGGTLMKKYWQPTLQFEKGLCYTFDPKKYGTFQIDIVLRFMFRGHSTN